MSKRALFMMLSSILLFPCIVSAHGTGGWLENFTGIRLVARYDDGEPMSYARVTIHAPDIDYPFQTGYTDRNGHFAFEPDVAGTFKVVVGDEVGHQLMLSTAVGVEQQTVQEDNSRILASRENGVTPGNVAGGLGVITGIAGILYGRRQKQLRDKGDFIHEAQEA